MTQSFTLTSPGIYTAALGLMQTAAASYPSTPTPYVVPFDLGIYEPAEYIVVQLDPPIKLAVEDTSYGYQEHYDLTISVVVSTGNSPFPPSAENMVAVDTMNTAFSIFQTCVLAPMVSARTIPILGYDASTSGAPGPYQMLLGNPTFGADVGHTPNGEPWGWEVTIDYKAHFDALIYPA